MPNVKKLIEKMKLQPNGIRPEEAEKVLAAYGYIPARQKGSHRQYLNKGTGDLITIKYPAASNGVSILQRCRAAGYLTLAAFANWPCKHGRLAHCSRE